MASQKAERRSSAYGTGKPKLWTARVCPFAERALLSLAYLNVDFDMEEINLLNKPEKFLALPTDKKVPVIEDNGNILYESMVLIEYIDETWKSQDGKRLLPESPVDRARVKILVSFTENKLNPFFMNITFAKSEEALRNSFKEFVTALETLDAKMRALSPTGPFMLGADVCIADIAMLPHVRRLDVLKEIFGLEVPKKPELERYHQWRDACFAVPAFKAIFDDIGVGELTEIAKRRFAALKG